MASLGIRKFQDLIGRTDLLRASEKRSSKATNLDFSLILKNAQELRPDISIEQQQISSSLNASTFKLDERLDNSIIERAKCIFDAIDSNISVSYSINNTDRAFGSTLSWQIAR